MANSATGGCGQIEAVATERVHLLKAGWKPSDRDASGNPKWLLGVKHCSLTWTSIASHSEADGIANDGECFSHGRGSNPAMRFAKYGWESAEWSVRASLCSDVPPHHPSQCATCSISYGKMPGRQPKKKPRCWRDIVRQCDGVVCLLSDSEGGMCNAVHPPKMNEWRAEHGVA